MIDSRNIYRRYFYLLCLMVGILPLAGTYGQGIAGREMVNTQIDGFPVVAKKMLEGGVTLFVGTIVEDQWVSVDPYTVEVERVEVERYFVESNGELILLTPSNYKKIIKTYLPEAPELHQRLGRRGFRYENIPQMVAFYNRFRWEKP